MAVVPAEQHGEHRREGRGNRRGSLAQARHPADDERAETGDDLRQIDEPCRVLALGVVASFEDDRDADEEDEQADGHGQPLAQQPRRVGAVGRPQVLARFRLFHGLHVPVAAQYIGRPDAEL